MAASISSNAPVLRLYDHHGWLEGWLRRKLGNAADAADLAQDTFVRILGRLDAGASADVTAASPVREPHRYLVTIANGLVIDHWRRKRIEQEYLAELAARPEQLSPSPEACLVILQTLYELDALLARLPPRAKRAFLLAQLDGLTYSEIAAKLGVSDRMVRKYMVQAMHCCLMVDTEGLS